MCVINNACQRNGSSVHAEVANRSNNAKTLNQRIRYDTILHVNCIAQKMILLCVEGGREGEREGGGRE